jgi:hypothetical protein
MLFSIAKLFVSAAVVVVIVVGASPSRADAAVFRDRPSFNAASQNLNTIDFESGANFPDGLGFLEIDGVFFRSPNAASIITGQNGNKLLRAPTLIEFTRLTISLVTKRQFELSKFCWSDEVLNRNFTQKILHSLSNEKRVAVALLDGPLSSRPPLLENLRDHRRSHLWRQHAVDNVYDTI